MRSAVQDKLKRRVEHFNRPADQIRSPDYNEHLIRVDFIDPLMKELGWPDVAGGEPCAAVASLSGQAVDTTASRERTHALAHRANSA